MSLRLHAAEEGEARVPADASVSKLDAEIDQHRHGEGKNMRKRWRPKSLHPHQSGRKPKYVGGGSREPERRGDEAIDETALVLPHGRTTAIGIRYREEIRHQQRKSISVAIAPLPGSAAVDRPSHGEGERHGYSADPGSHEVTHPPLWPESAPDPPTEKRPLSVPLAPGNTRRALLPESGVTQAAAEPWYARSVSDRMERDPLLTERCRGGAR